MTHTPSTKVFRLKHRTWIVQVAIYLVFGISCIVQVFMRLGLETDSI